MYKKTLPEQIKEKLDKLEVGDSLHKKHFVIELYQNYDFFLQRSFDVHFSKAKEMLSDKIFRCIAGRITRLN